jgi:hypothetical protein
MKCLFLTLKAAFTLTKFAAKFAAKMPVVLYLSWYRTKRQWFKAREHWQSLYAITPTILHCDIAFLTYLGQ